MSLLLAIAALALLVALVENRRERARRTEAEEACTHHANALRIERRRRALLVADAEAAWVVALAWADRARAAERESA